jgi:hypothetical protein
MKAARLTVTRSRDALGGCSTASLRRNGARSSPAVSGPPAVVSVVELATRGLDRHPLASGVRWTDPGLVVCRRHLLGPLALRSTAQSRAPRDMAVVVFDAREAGECLACLVRSAGSRQR